MEDGIREMYRRQTGAAHSYRVYNFILVFVLHMSQVNIVGELSFWVVLHHPLVAPSVDVERDIVRMGNGK